MKLPFPLKSHGWRIEKNAIVFNVQLEPNGALFFGKLLTFLKNNHELTLEITKEHGIKSIVNFFELSLKLLSDNEKKE